MRRREFIALIGGAAASWPFAVGAQQSTKQPIIGFLGASTALNWSQWLVAFVQRLREHGWIDGRTVAIEVRWAEGRSERYAEIAAEFVRLKVDVIVTSGAAVLAVKEATSIIPIVFAAAIDPVGSGLVASLARPGGNVTGLSIQNTETTGKRVELLRELVPGLRRLAIIDNVSYPATVPEMEEVQIAARTLGLEVTRLEITSADDIAPTFEAVKDRAEALYLITDPLVTANRIRINTLANVARLPTIASQSEYVEAGTLMSYGPNFPGMFRRAADYVDKILHGTKPADIPVEQPKSRADALYVAADLLVVANRSQINALALTLRLPTIYNSREYVELGGLMSYGSNFLDMFRRAAELSAGFCAGRSLPTSRWSSRLSSSS